MRRFPLRSDTVASLDLAPKIFAKMQTGPVFKQLAMDARAEWA